MRAVMTPLECADILKTELRRCAAVVGERFGWTSIKLEIRYDVRGTVAGYAFRDERVRFNMMLLIEQSVEHIREIAAHEFAHIAVYREWREVYRVDQLPGEIAMSNAFEAMPAPHGREWRRMMRLFGHAPRRCHPFDTRAHQVRR